jgi:hypothetical protein
MVRIATSASANDDTANVIDDDILAAFERGTRMHVSGHTLPVLLLLLLYSAVRFVVVTW